MKSLLTFFSGVSLGAALLTSLPEPQQDKQTVAQFPNLQKGLQETPGCLGVQTFGASGGKQVIAAWFENRKAMEAWYYGKMHQEAMAKFFPSFEKTGRPFAEFRDEKAPLLIIASVTPGEKPIGNGSRLAVSQIAIEGYTPIPGGIAIGGTFAPESLLVPGLVRLASGS